MNDITVILGAEEARRLTDEVKHDAAALWDKLLSLYEGKAHESLGYSSWGAYYEAEFGQTPVHGYRLLNAARVMEALPSNHLVTESQARELVPLKDDPEAVREAYAEAGRRTDGQPTAAVVRDVVREWLQEGQDVMEDATAGWSDEQRERWSGDNPRKRGELKRLARDIAALPDPTTYARELADIKPQALDAVEAAHAWLTDFLNEWRTA